MKFKENCSK